jgi:hypothetical protein
MELLHFLGICPDTLSHTDLMDILIISYNETQLVFRRIVGFFNL